MQETPGLLYISKKWNWFPKIDPTHRSFSTFCKDNSSNVFQFFHHASKRAMMWSHRRDISKHVSSFKPSYCTWIFNIGPLDFNRFDGFLNSSIDFKNIPNYSIPWDNDHTQACTTPITKIETPRVNTDQISIAATITSSIESNNLRVKQIESIQVSRVAQVPPRAILLRHQRKKVYSSLNSAYRDDMRGSDTQKRLTTVASIVQWLVRSLMPLLNNHHTSSVTYQPSCKSLDQGKKPCNAQFSILDDDKTLHPYGNESRSRHTVASWTRL